MFPCKKSPYGIQGILVRRRRSPKRRTETLRTFRLIGIADNVVESCKCRSELQAPCGGFEVVSGDDFEEDVVSYC